MAGIPGLGGLGGAGGGLAGLLGKIPGPAGKALSAVAPLAEMAASLVPGGAAVTAGLDVAGGIAATAIDKSKASGDGNEKPNPTSILF
ncbi:hypothetical protein ACSFA3_04090 [Variovorax sp. RHLX14]|uniref:hypothetical protein n=1 Tax=Variovorax sp. RHLX14 TaxID=1259731 RepID=UPI003F48855B